MSTIFKLDSVAYFGEKNNHNNDISKKLAKVYNENFNIEKLSENINNLIYFNLPDDMSHLKKEYIKNEGVLKVYDDVNSDNYFVMPTIYSDFSVYNKYYNPNAIINESSSLIESISIGLNKGVVLEREEELSQNSLVESFDYLFENSQKDLFEASFIKKIQDTLARLYKDEKTTGSKDDDSDAKESLENLSKIAKQFRDNREVENKKKSTKSKDRNKEALKAQNNQGAEFVILIKDYLKTAGMNNEEAHLIKISNEFGKYFAGEANKNNAQETIENLLKNVKKTDKYEIVNNEIKNFLDKTSKIKGMKTRLPVFRAHIESKLNEIYKLLSDPSLDIKDLQQKDKIEISKKDTAKAFVGSARKKIKKSKVYLQIGKNILKAVIEFCKGLWNFFTLIFKNKSKTFAASTIIGGFLQIINSFADSFTQMINSTIKTLFIGAVNSSSYVDALPASAREALNKIISDLAFNITSFYLQVITNPIYAFKNNFDNILENINSLSTTMNKIASAPSAEPIAKYLNNVLPDIYKFLYRNSYSLNLAYIAIVSLCFFYIIHKIGIPDIMAHAVKQVGKVIEIIVSVITNTLSGASLPSLVGLIDVEYLKSQDEGLEDFIKETLLGLDGVDTRVAQATMLQQIVVSTTALKIEDNLFGKEHLENLNKVANLYLDQMNKEFETFEEISKNVKKLIKDEMLKLAKAAEKSTKVSGSSASSSSNS